MQYKESLNSIGSVQLFYPLLHYLSSNPEYFELVTNEWACTAKTANQQRNENLSPTIDFKHKFRKSYFDGKYNKFWNLCNK